MKKLLILLFSLFFLSSPSVFADDISDFQIEGISIGDSLLDYMTEDEILKEIENTKDNYYYLNEPNKYSEVYIRKEFSSYNGGISFMVVNKGYNKYISNINTKYKVLSIRGLNRYIEDFDSCIQKRDEIAANLSNMFPNAEKSYQLKKHSFDPSGNSIIDSIVFYLKSGGAARVHCSNWEETLRNKNNFSEGLSVGINSKEIVEWLTPN